MSRKIVSHKERKDYARVDINVKEKMRSRIHKGAETSLGDAIMALRNALGLRQVPFSKLLGVNQSAVSRWERGHDRPAPSILITLSDMAAEPDRQWWRDRAAEQAGLNTFSESAKIEQLLPQTFRRIKLLKDSRNLGQMDGCSLQAVERDLFVPSEWFPEGGLIQAAHVAGAGHRDMIAVVDVSQSDAETLVDNMVAVRTVEGVEVRWLVAEDGVYLLLPFAPGQTVKRLRREGESSIVGLVRWIGNAIAPPPPRISVQ